MSEPERRTAFVLDSRTADEAAALSRRQLRFLEAVSRDVRWLDRGSFPGLWDDSPLFPPALQPWPTFVSRELSEDVSRRLSRLTTLVEANLQRRLADDFDGVSERFGRRYDRELRQLARRTSPHGRALRADLVETDAGFRCIELNVGGALGGWEIGVVCARLETVPLVQEFLRSGDSRPAPYRPFDVACRRFAQIARSRRGSVVFVGGAALSLQRRDFFEMAVRALASSGGNDDTPWHFRRPQDFSLDEAGRVTTDGLDAPIAVIVDAGDPPLGEPFMRMAEDREIDMFSGPLGLLLSDKRCLALLREDVERGALDSDDAALVLSMLPATHVVDADLAVQCASGVGDFGDRGRWVLKPGDQFGGRDVTVGTETAADAWLATVRRAAAEKTWVLQERLEGRLRPLQTGPSGWAPHHVVWGWFVLEGGPGGIYLRVLPTTRGLVVNVSRGGESALVFEVDETGVAAGR